MQFNISTDYAIRIVLYLALINDKVYAKDLANNLCIPESYVYKITKKLQSDNFINCKAGHNGGFKLSKTPEQITLYDIINLMEPTVRINRCLEDDKYCSRYATEDCPVRKFYTGVQGAVEKQLKSITIAELIKS